MKQPTKERFLEDIKDHKMTIIHDDGIYRHLIFSKGSFDMRYEIITFPGGLLMTGDMGTWEFERTEDMFNFFRHPEGNLEINIGYWAEKCQAESVCGGGIREFDPDRFRECVRNYWEESFYKNTESEKAKEVWDDIENQILSAEDSEWDLVSSLNNFYRKDFDFSDFWENTVTIKTYHYVWACYAIAWAVIQYDREKENN
jgi:hypothetical protein